MSLEIVKANYQGIEVSFNEDGWFDATSAAEKYGKRVDHYLANAETKEYIYALCEEDNPLKVSDYNTRKVGDYKVTENHFIKAKKGKNGGTWFHPDLAVHFARWLDVKFAIWCDRQIRNIIQGNHPHYDWKRMRHEASSSFKVMNAVLQLQRQPQGKETQDFHYANEAKLINWALTGEFQKLDRESLSYGELSLLAKLEERNAILIGIGADRDTRKLAIVKFVEDSRAPKAIPADQHLIDKAA